MRSDRFSSGRALQSWILWFEVRAAVVALIPAALFVWPIVSLDGEQIAFLAAGALALFGLGGAIGGALARAQRAPLARYLAAVRTGRPDPETCRSAFRAVMDLPRFTFFVGYVVWCTGGFLVGALMHLRFASISGVDFLCIFSAGFAAGLISQTFTYLWLRRNLEPLRAQIAADVGDPAVRSRLVRRNPIASRVIFTTTALLLMNLFFGLGFAHVRSGDRADAAAAAWKQEILDGVTRAVEPTEDAAVALAALESLLAASSPTSAASDGILLILIEYGPLILLCAAIGVVLTYYGARDFARAAEVLSREVERVAAGDLTAGKVFESEDEFGDLSRSFERMAGSLRAAVGRITETADRVEGAAERIAAASAAVAGVTSEQVNALESSAGSMQEIHEQVREIAESSAALSASMDASSSSLGLIAFGSQGLHEKAGILSTRVADVSASIERTVGSVTDVGRRAEELAGRSTAVSASMTRMQESIQDVASGAAESADLANRVFASAERGQERVRQTIAGMEAIRQATESAHSVIQSLSRRAGRIGGILDVIDDVAGKTNLLALNAAIIAARAGEQGRAFGVVAEEVKSLADRVLTSTKEIAEVIGAVQEESARAVEAIERGARSVREGVHLSAEAGISLEEITRSARESGDRIASIVSVIEQQLLATSSVVDLMQQVRAGADAIQDLGRVQVEGTEVVQSSTEAMGEVAGGVRRTAQEQARSVDQLRDGIERVVKTSAAIAAALQAQREASASAARLLTDVSKRTRSNEASTIAMDEEIAALAQQAEDLRADLRLFKT